MRAKISLIIIPAIFAITCVLSGMLTSEGRCDEGLVCRDKEEIGTRSCNNTPYPYDETGRFEAVSCTGGKQSGDFRVWICNTNSTFVPKYDNIMFCEKSNRWTRRLIQLSDWKKPVNRCDILCGTCPTGWK